MKALKTVEYFCYDGCLRDIPRTLKWIRSDFSAVNLRKRQQKLGINRYTGALPNEFDITSQIESMTELIATLLSKCKDWSLILFGNKSKRQMEEYSAATSDYQIE